MRVEVWYRDEIGDGRAARLLASLRAGALPALAALRIRDVYLVTGVVGLAARRLQELVCDRVAQEAAVVPARDAEAGAGPDWDLLLEVAVKPGVADPVAGTLREALRTVLELAVPEAALVQTARQYRFSMRSGTLDRTALGALFNPLIQSGLVLSADDWWRGKRPPQQYPGVGGNGAGLTTVADRVARFAIAGMSDRQLTELSAQRLLALSLSELHAVRDYYRTPAVGERRRDAGLDEAATDVELEMIAQTWSEHCKHKIFNATIEYREGGRSETIRSLFDRYIRATTHQVDPGDGFLRSVFHDNSGVIEFDPETLLCFKAETHNSPSALDPYGGAITGIVGVNRDILGTGRGARPIFNTNVLCFAPPRMDEVPNGLLPPRAVLEGVHRGIVDGGNQSGIPTVAGAVLFDPSFVGKPLVFCGTGGIMPASLLGAPAWEAEPCAGDLAVMVGGRIGRDGIHGATFSSLALNESSPLSAVQIGDPITQKKMSDFLLEARDRGLYRAITDNGAGGLSSSFGEMARACGGVRLELERAPLKYHGLEPWEILVSESQERMSLAVPPEHYEALADLARRREVEVTALGEFTADGTVEVRYAQRLVALLELEFLHDGLPEMVLQARWEPPQPAPAAAAAVPHPQEVLPRLLADPNIASKETLVRQYDHEVQALTVGKPFVGRCQDGPSDGAVLQPRPDSLRAITVTHGICPWYSTWDTWHMAMCAVDEAVRGHVACGGDPDRMAALDNFCWPDPIAGPDNPDGAHKLAQLVRAARGLRAACLAYRLPLISGKDSMKNDAVVDGRRISVLPTLLVSVLGIIEDLRRSVSSDFKQPGDRIFIVGADRGEVGGSAYARLLGGTGGAGTGAATGVRQQGCPTVDAPAAMARYRLLHAAMRAGIVASAHDLSDGGLAVALAESAIGGRLGARLDLARVPVDGATRREAGYERAAPAPAAPDRTGDRAGVRTACPGAAANSAAPAGNATSRHSALLFSETAGRLLVSVPPAAAERMTEHFAGHDCAAAGEVTGDGRVTVVDGAATVARWRVEELVRAWQTPP